ncbi:MAG: hypothetical protein KDC38_11270, partial [Planctomycetes bacterium]|nr:hypothetical protein [Planctomycetota bacterium]
DNVAVIGGASITPDLVDGSVVCEAVTPCVPVIEGLTFICGGAGGFDSPIEGTPGSTVDVCFYYTSETNVQGFQLAVCFDCNLTLGTFSIAGSIADEVGAEFVNYNVDNDPDDGDGCEMIVGILLDVFPPFAGQTLPPTDIPLLIGCAEATISPEAQCEELLTVEFCDFIDGAGDVAIENIAVIGFESVQNLPKHCCAVRVGGPDPCHCLEIGFCDFINGVGSVLIENIAVIDFESYQNIGKVPGEICLDRRVRFLRGDCNQDSKTDIADAAAVLGQQFFALSFSCRDACDVNDDGLVDLADTIFLLNYLLDFASAPPAPFPICGYDLSEDSLDCESYSECP